MDVTKTSSAVSAAPAAAAAVAILDDTNNALREREEGDNTDPQQPDQDRRLSLLESNMRDEEDQEEDEDSLEDEDDDGSLYHYNDAVVSSKEDRYQRRRSSRSIPHSSDDEDEFLFETSSEAGGSDWNDSAKICSMMDYDDDEPDYTTTTTVADANAVDVTLYSTLSRKEHVHITSNPSKTPKDPNTEEVWYDTNTTTPAGIRPDLFCTDDPRNRSSTSTNTTNTSTTSEQSVPLEELLVRRRHQNRNRGNSTSRTNTTDTNEEEEGDDGSVVERTMLRFGVGLDPPVTPSSVAASASSTSVFSLSHMMSPSVHNNNTNDDMDGSTSISMLSNSTVPTHTNNIRNNISNNHNKNGNTAVFDNYTTMENSQDKMQQIFENSDLFQDALTWTANNRSNNNNNNNTTTPTVRGSVARYGHDDGGNTYSTTIGHSNTNPNNNNYQKTIRFANTVATIIEDDDRNWRTGNNNTNTNDTATPQQRGIFPTNDDSFTSRSSTTSGSSIYSAPNHSMRLSQLVLNSRCGGYSGGNNNNSKSNESSIYLEDLMIADQCLVDPVYGDDDFADDAQRYSSESHHTVNYDDDDASYVSCLEDDYQYGQQYDSEKETERKIKRGLMYTLFGFGTSFHRNTEVK